MFKIIGIDMDGTLLNTSHELSYENIDAIKEAQNRGVEVVITTGRPFSGVKNFLKPLDMNKGKKYVILYNGAQIIDVYDKSVVFESLFTKEEVLNLYELSLKLGVKIHVVTSESCISPDDNEYGRYEAELNDMEYVEKSFSNLDDKDKVFKVMFSEDSSKLKNVFKRLSVEMADEYELTMSADFYIDFMKKGVSKGNAVKELSKILSIDRDKIICIGDAGNDMSMIEYAGLGVAMGNGDIRLREKADYITLNNDENGVAHVIKKFALR